MKNIISILLTIFFIFSCTKEDETPKIEQFEINEELILNLVNDLRTTGCNCGDTYMPPVDEVVWDERLESAARLNTEHFYKTGLLQHVWDDGTSVADRYKKVGIDNWVALGENIAYSKCGDEEHVFRLWTDSPSHCKVMMSSKLQKMGVANTDIYWSMNFITEF